MLESITPCGFAAQAYTTSHPPREDARQRASHTRLEALHLRLRQAVADGTYTRVACPPTPGAPAGPARSSLKPEVRAALRAHLASRVHREEPGRQPGFPDHQVLAEGLFNGPADVVASHYDPDLLPRMVRERPPTGLHFLIYKTSPGSNAPTERWITENYGLRRYDVPIHVRHAWEVTGFETLHGLPVILTTGSIVDLGRKHEYPWIKTFRETVLKQAVENELPVIAPCYGLAELAQLYAQPGEDAFPKGIRELGAKRLEVVSDHPVLYGLSSLTAYTHHNGTVPWELIGAHPHTLQIHAVTKHPGTGQAIPALVSFNGSVTLGTSFHREILDDEALFLFERSAMRKIDRLAQSAAFQRLHPFEREERLEALRASVRETHRIDALQEAMAETLDAPEDLRWMNDYLIGSRYDPASQGYNRLASFLFFDNLLRLAIAKHTGLAMPRTGLGEAVKLKGPAPRERMPLHGFVRGGELYTVELMGSTPRELQEMTDLYIHGFGDHLPMQADEHRVMAEQGDVIAIRNAQGRLVAMRALVYSPEHANPYDKHVGPHHAYQNHSVVHQDWRGQGMVEALTEVSIRLAQQRNKAAIITSVSPTNIANLRALLRQGYVLRIYSEEHFGPGEHRYMLELPTTPRIPAQRRGNGLEHADAPPNYPGGPAREAQYKAETVDTVSASALLGQGYEGVGTAIAEDRNYLVFRRVQG